MSKHIITYINHCSEEGYGEGCGMFDCDLPQPNTLHLAYRLCEWFLFPGEGFVTAFLHLCHQPFHCCLDLQFLDVTTNREGPQLVSPLLQETLLNFVQSIRMNRSLEKDCPKVKAHILCPWAHPCCRRSENPPSISGQGRHEWKSAVSDSTCLSTTA